MRGTPGGLSGTPAAAGPQSCPEQRRGPGRPMWPWEERAICMGSGVQACTAPQVPQKSRRKFAPARMEQSCLSPRSRPTLEIRAKSSQVRQTLPPTPIPGGLRGSHGGSRRGRTEADVTRREQSLRVRRKMRGLPRLQGALGGPLLHGAPAFPGTKARGDSSNSDLPAGSRSS